MILHDFHRAHPEIDLDVVTLIDSDLTAAITAVRDGTVDASFRAVTMPSAQIPDGVATVRAIDHRLEVLLGPTIRWRMHESWPPRSSPATEFGFRASWKEPSGPPSTATSLPLST